MTLWREVDFGEMIRLDADGKLRSLRPLPADAIATFNPRDPRDVAALSRIYELYTGRTGIDERHAAARWLDRFSITPDDPRYAAEFDRLIEAGASSRAVLAEQRRIAERTELLHMTGGDLHAHVIYVNEGPNPCPECAALGGEVGTLAEMQAAHNMPGDRCLGGDNCLCQLIPIDLTGG